MEKPDPKSHVEAEKVSQPNGDKIDDLFAISDDGPGLATTISKPEKIFQKGFTTSDEGSGRGLYHVAETLKKMNLDMVISEEPAAGWSGLSLEVVRNVN